jgi:hypothetical protein
VEDEGLFEKTARCCQKEVLAHDPFQKINLKKENFEK